MLPFLGTTAAGVLPVLASATALAMAPRDTVPGTVHHRTLLPEAAPSRGWLDMLDGNLTSSGSDRSLAATLWRMSLLTYEATSGSNFRAELANSTIDDWERPMTLNPAAGVRALVFAKPALRLAVVAFRGQDFSAAMDGTGTYGGVADFCNSLLVVNKSLSAAPQCAAYSSATLDYMGQAVAFMGNVRRTLRGFDLIFTGHSSGGAWAMSMAAHTPGAPVRPGRPSGVWPCLAFSVVDWTDGYYVAFGRPPPSLEVARGTLVAYGDEYDPIAWLTPPGRVGTACMLRSSADLATGASAHCRSCWSLAASEVSPTSSNVTFWEEGCAECIGERHANATLYLTEVEEGAPPVCVDAAEGELSICALKPQFCNSSTAQV